jgi:hypothetical protein
MESSHNLPIPLPPNEILFKKYNNQYLAIYNQKIYAISESFDDIHQSAEETVPKDKYYII